MHPFGFSDQEHQTALDHWTENVEYEIRLESEKAAQKCQPFLKTQYTQELIKSKMVPLVAQYPKSPEMSLHIHIYTATHISLYTHRHTHTYKYTYIHNC